MNIRINYFRLIGGKNRKISEKENCNGIMEDWSYGVME
jgi:hypothetical protein